MKYQTQLCGVDQPTRYTFAGSTTASVDAALNMSIRVLDKYGNIAALHSGTVQVVASEPALTSTLVVVRKGLASVLIESTTPGTSTVEFAPKLLPNNTEASDTVDIVFESGNTQRRLYYCNH